MPEEHSQLSPLTLSIKAALERSGGVLSRTKLYDDARAGKIRFYKFCGRTALRTPEFDNYLLAELKPSGEVAA